MGEPAIPSAADRAAARALAARIVESVRADERMPLGLDSDGAGLYRVFLANDVEELAFRLAQEIQMLADERDRVRRGLCEDDREALRWVRGWLSTLPTQTMARRADAVLDRLLANGADQ